MTRWAGGALVLGTLGALVGCGPSGPLGNPCLPEPLTVAPAQAPAGSTVTLSSPGFGCDAEYPAGQEYQLTLGLLGRQGPVDLGSVPVERNGSFSAQVTIPADVSTGPAGIGVGGSPYDDCDDTAGASCAGYWVDLAVLPAG